MYFVSEDQVLYAVNPQGLTKWTYKIPVFTYYDFVDSSPAIGSDGTVYVGGYNELFAIYPNGTLRWNYTADGWQFTSPTVDAAGNVYAACVGGTLYALRADGGLRWKYTVGGLQHTSPVIGPDGMLYIAGFGQKSLYAIGAGQGP